MLGCSQFQRPLQDTGINPRKSGSLSNIPVLLSTSAGESKDLSKFTTTVEVLCLCIVSKEQPSPDTVEDVMCSLNCFYFTSWLNYAAFPKYATFEAETRRFCTPFGPLKPEKCSSILKPCTLHRDFTWASSPSWLIRYYWITSLVYYCIPLQAPLRCSNVIRNSLQIVIPQSIHWSEWHLKPNSALDDKRHVRSKVS